MTMIALFAEALVQMFAGHRTLATTAFVAVALLGVVLYDGFSWVGISAIALIAVVLWLALFAADRPTRGR